MKIVSKFILNRDDKEFWYVEKARISRKSDRMKYFVHQTPNNVIEYSDHTFHSVHSIDEKISVAYFTKKAINNLLSELHDENSKLGHDFLTATYEKVERDSNIHNPNLKGVRTSLLNGIYIYNQTMFEIGNLEIPYEENYRLITEDKENTYIRLRQKVMSISSLIPENTLGESEIRRIKITPVKDLVRTKKAA